MYKILVVDDEIKIIEVVKSYLEKEGYAIVTALDGKEAIKRFCDENPDLVILDLMLPYVSGEEVCKYIREKSNTYVVMLTAKTDETSVINGLEYGADEYVIKPFSVKELVARVKSLLRRKSAESTSDIKNNIASYNDNDLQIYYLKNEVRKKGAILNLTPKEYKILEVLSKNKNKVFTRDELISSVFGTDFIGFDRTVDTHIKNIRRKIETDNKNPVYIRTIHSVGYRFGGILDEI